MAEYTEGYAATRAPQGAGKLVHLAGAAVSFGLIVGVGVWGYKLVMRDVSGIPVVRAIEGPMRLSPENPGGEIASNIGLAVNAVAAEGGAAAPEDSEVLVLAPPEVSLSREDLEVQSTAEAGEFVASVANNTPMPERVEPVATDPATSVEPSQMTAASAEPVTSEEPAASVVESPSDAPLTAEQILALADQLAAGAVTIDASAGEAVPAKTSVNGVSSDFIADIVPASVPGVSNSLRPIHRPRTAAPAPVVQASVATPTDASVTTDALTVGTNLVQLGAYESPEVAAQEWVRFTGRFSDFMAGKDRVIQEAERGGKTFFRLRAKGFTDIADARRFCAALMAEGTDCVPVVVR